MFYCAPFNGRLRFVLHDYVSINIVIHVVQKVGFHVVRKVGFQTCFKQMTLLIGIHQKALELLHYHCMWNYLVSWYFVRKLKTLRECFFLVLYYVVHWLYCTCTSLIISAKRYWSKCGCFFIHQSLAWYEPWTSH